MRSSATVSRVSVTVLAMLVLVEFGARAQPCDVDVGDEVTVHTGAPVMVRMAWDRATDVPAALWLDATGNEVAFSRWTGPGDADWEVPTVVDKGSVHAPPGFDWGGWRMIALAFDSYGLPHVVVAGEETAGSGTMGLWYVHQWPEGGWSSPAKIHDLPATGSCDWEPFVEADFDSSGRLHVASHNYGGEGEVAVILREGGAWSAPEIILTNAAGMDMAVGADDAVHVLTIRRAPTGNESQYQAFHKGRRAGEAWTGDNGTQITHEPEIDCIAGPLACWPSLTTDRAGHPHVAYGVDPDPCQPEELYRFKGHISYIRMTGGGDWTEPESVLETGFMPWRARVLDDTPYLIGYTGGENIYEAGTEEIAVKWLTTSDGRAWSAAVPGHEAVLTGGSSETDFTFLADGTLIAVARNEEGDDDGFGSKICRASPDDLGSWECAADPRKYDSPLVFRHGDTVYLIGRRNVTESGNFDLGYDDRSLDDQFQAYQLDYWVAPKRCSL